MTLGNYLIYIYQNDLIHIFAMTHDNYDYLKN